MSRVRTIEAPTVVDLPALVDEPEETPSPRSSRRQPSTPTENEEES